jgi:hypothetical protein
MWNSNRRLVLNCNLKIKKKSFLNIVERSRHGVSTCNSSIQEPEAGESQVQGLPGLYSKTLISKKKKKFKRWNLVSTSNIVPVTA